MLYSTFRSHNKHRLTRKRGGGLRTAEK